MMAGTTVRLRLPAAKPTPGMVTEIGSVLGGTSVTLHSRCMASDACAVYVVLYAWTETHGLLPRRTVGVPPLASASSTTSISMSTREPAYTTTGVTAKSCGACV